MLDRDYAAFVDAVRSDERVVGLVLTGSRGRGAFIRTESDWDIRLVVRDEAFAARQAVFGTPRGSPVEVVVYSVGEFERAALAGSANEWDRYSYAHSEVVLDKLDGRIGGLVAEKGMLSPAEADRLARAALDAYFNSYYRSVKNFQSAIALAGLLDAAESIPHLLTAIFAIHERVRPYNKFLRWELENFPLDGDLWSAESLLPRLEKITTTGDLAEQQRLFRDVEDLVRTRGLGDVIDGWQPDLDLLRGTLDVRAG